MNMEHVKRALPLALGLALILALAFGLANSRPGGPDLPMEVWIDGDAVTLGRTALSDLTELGWTAKLNGAQREIRGKDKYVAFHYRLYKNQDPDSQFLASVYVPFLGNFSDGTADVSQERAGADTEGVVYRVELHRDACARFHTVYNGVDVQDLDTASFRAWGGERAEGEDPAVYRLETSRGTVEFQPSRGEGVLSVTMGAAAFERLAGRPEP